VIETSQLSTLVAVARAKSFSKAAEDLHVTQSAISQSIKNLENKLEVKLFKRSGKKVVLTPEGEKLHTLAQSYLTQMEDTLQEIHHARDSMSGRVRIATLTGIGKSWLAPEMLQFAAENPELTVSIELGFQEDLVSAFENFRYDFLVLPEETLPTVGERKLIGEERSVLVYPDSPDFKIGPSITLEELSKLPTVLFQEEGDGLYLKWCRERFGRVPQKINKRYIINSHGNMLQAVQKGLGVAVVPQHVLKRSYYKDKVKMFSDQEVSNGRFFVVYHKDAQELLRMRKTLERLLDVKNPLAKV
jgi:DNA-binding transcriptional LysR family regulator